MGFTHYWRTHKTGIPEAAWEKICADVRKLLSNLPAHSTSAGSLKIAWEEDEPNRAPEVSGSLIRFNGIGESGHETFMFERVPEPQDWQDQTTNSLFGFCKTARKPYDLVVCGVLIVVAKHARRYVRVTSDGDLADWMPAFKWVVSLLGQEYAASAVAARLTGEFRLGAAEDAPDPQDTDPEDESESAEVPCGTSVNLTDGEMFDVSHAREPKRAANVSGLSCAVYTDISGSESPDGRAENEDELPKLRACVSEAGETDESSVSEVRKREIGDASCGLQQAAGSNVAVPTMPFGTSPEPITTSSTIVVDVKEFRAALELAVSEKKTTIPVLNEVCLQPHGDCLHILSSDLDKWTITEVHMKDCVQKGRHHSPQKVKTHCAQGHPYDATNTYYYVYPSGLKRRRCKACNNTYYENRKL